MDPFFFDIVGFNLATDGDDARHDISVVLIAGFGAVLVMPAETAGSVLWLGLPPRTAIVLYGIGVLPLFLLPLAYAYTFDTMTLSEDDLARIAELRRVREDAERLDRGVAS